MAALLHQRCLQHPAREAVSRCPACRHYFCRECVTEHDGRLLCRACLATHSSSTSTRRPRPILGWTAGALTGFALLWTLLYYIGVLFARIPSEFHEALQ